MFNYSKMEIQRGTLSDKEYRELRKRVMGASGKAELIPLLKELVQMEKDGKIKLVIDQALRDAIPTFSETKDVLFAKQSGEAPPDIKDITLATLFDNSGDHTFFDKFYAVAGVTHAMVCQVLNKASLSHEERKKLLDDAHDILDEAQEYLRSIAPEMRDCKLVQQGEIEAKDIPYSLTKAYAAAIAALHEKDPQLASVLEDHWKRIR